MQNKVIRPGIDIMPVDEIVIKWEKRRRNEREIM